MKNFAGIFMMFVLVLTLAACGNDSTAESKGSDGEKELADTLKIFSWGDYIPESVIEGFEEEYGVEVVYDPYSSNAEMMTKLQSGAVNYDIVVPTDYIVTRMVKKDLLAEVNLDNIPNFENLEESFKERAYDPENKYSVPYLYGSIGLAYNKKKVDNVTGWKDLWNPEYAGHIVLSDVARESVSVAMQKNGDSVNNPTEENLEEAKKALKELDPNVKTYTSSVSEVLASGDDVWLAAGYSGAVGKAMKQNPNLSYMLPEEGGILWMDNLAIPKISDNQYTAETFINYLLRPKVSKQISDVIPYSNPNAEAVALMSEETKQNPAMYQPEEKLKNAEWFEDLGPDLQKIDRVWREVIGD